MDLDLPIIGFSERCGPAYNRDIWAVFRVVARVYSCPRFVLKVCVLEVFGILSIQCSDVSLFVDLFMCYLMTAYLKIFPEFGKNYSFLSHEGKEKTILLPRRRRELKN